MTNVDQFESMFRAASREVFQPDPVTIDSVLIVTDLEKDDAASFSETVRRFFKVVNSGEKPTWRVVGASEFRSAGDLLTLTESADPDLICTYRNLHSDAWRWPYSLGTHVDLLTQHTGVPVMLLPHPNASRSASHAMKNTDCVMAITDHMTGDDRLVNHALRFTENKGTIWLTHVEDEGTFERFLDVISKIPAIDTDEARTALQEQLLKEPQDYIAGCIEVLQEAGANVTIKDIVLFGHHLFEYKRLIEQHAIDLLVLNTKNDDQLAMRGIAYALAVELRQIPLLML